MEPGPARGPGGPRRSLGHGLGQTRIRVGAKLSEPQVDHPQNTDLDALNPTILFIRRETAGKAGTKFGFHPIKLSVGPTTTRAGIIIPHYPQGGVGESSKLR